MLLFSINLLTHVKVQCYHCKDILLASISKMYMVHEDCHVTEKLLGNWVSCVLSDIGDKTLHNQIPVVAGQSSIVNS